MRQRIASPVMQTQRPPASLAFIRRENQVAALVLLGIYLCLASNYGPFASPSCVFGICGGICLTAKLMLGTLLSSRLLTLPGVFLAAYFCLLAVPSLIVFGQMDTQVRLTYLWAIQSVLITFPIGVVIASSLFPNARAQVDQYVTQPIEVTPGDLRFQPWVRLAFFLSLAVVGVYLCIAEYIPVAKLFVDMSQEIDDLSLRFSVTELPKGLLFMLALSRSLALPICVLYLFFLSRVGNLRWLRDFYFVFAVAIVVACLSLERAPLVALCGMLCMGISISYNHLPIRPSLVIGVGTVLVIAMSLAGVISAYQYSSDVTLADIVEGTRHVVVNRIVLASARAAGMAFEEFPTPAHRLHGKYIRMFALLTGGEYLESRYAPRLVILPVSFVGDLWRNWGINAVYAGGICMGFVYQTIQLLLFRRKTVISSVFQAILILACVWLIPGNAFGIMTTSILVLATLLGKFGIELSLRHAPPMTAPTAAPTRGPGLPQAA